MSILKNPPVFMTLSKVNFNPYMEMSKFLPAIQESFRQLGYPDFLSVPLITIQVRLQDNQSIPTPIPQERYQFGNLEKTHMFFLDNQSLTLQSTKYGSFNEFSKCFMEGLEIIHAALNLSYVERIGLRYLDRVMPIGDDPIEKYLHPSIIGLGAQLGGTQAYSFTEGVNMVDSIKLVSRVTIQQQSGLAFPPDLAAGQLNVEKRFGDYTGPGAILDNDGSIDGRETFTAKHVYASLDKIHKVIGVAFRKTATPYAFTIWDQ